MALDMAIAVGGTGLLGAAIATVVITTGSDGNAGPPHKANFGWYDGPIDSKVDSTPSPDRPDHTRTHRTTTPTSVASGHPTG